MSLDSRRNKETDKEMHKIYRGRKRERKHYRVFLTIASS